MSTVLTESTNEPNLLAFQWNWRLAQQAFAPLLGSGLRDAPMLIAVAGRSLSALSADDRPTLDRWLILQLATGVAPGSAVARRKLARVDSSLGGSDGATVSQVREELCAHSRAGATA